MKKAFIYFSAIATIFVLIYFSFPTKSNELLTKEDFYRQTIIDQNNIIKKIFSSASDMFATVFQSSEDIINIPMKFHRQEHPVTCELASLRMSLNYVGYGVTETDLINKIAYDPILKSKMKNNIWGDPDFGFVGSVDGSVFNGTGYGVYNKPIKDLALNYATSSYLMEKANLQKVLSEVEKKHPVIVWGLLSYRKPMYWKTVDEKVVEAYPGEHARVVIGYTGNIYDPKQIILMDPLYGKVKIETQKFLTDWEKENNRAVVII